MIQDILPYRLDQTFCNVKPSLKDCFFSFRDGQVLLKILNNEIRRLPNFNDLHQSEKIRNLATFLFQVDGVSVFLIDSYKIIESEKRCDIDKYISWWAYKNRGFNCRD